MEPHLDRGVSCLLPLVLLIPLCLAAPGLPGTQRDDIVDALPPVAALHNPFGSGEEDRRLLQSYIQSSLKNSSGEPDISTWEQEVFFLFGLHDYDRSGFLDGLEMMKLLSDYNSHHSPGEQASEQVVSMVDFLLQTQDLNQDGLLTPTELLSAPLTVTKDSNDNSPPHQEQEVKEVEAKEEEIHEETQPQEEENQPQHQITTKEEEAADQIDKQEAHQIPEHAEEEQVHRVPVHQGQPEM